MPRTDGCGPFEKHIEKVVLGVSAIALVSVLALRVVSSPCRLELTPPANVGMTRGSYGPDQVDEALRDMAEKVDRVLKDVKASSEPVRPWARELDDKFRRPCAVASLTPPVSGSVTLVLETPPEDK